MPAMACTEFTQAAIDDGARWRNRIDRLTGERDEALERIRQLEDLLMARNTARLFGFGLTYLESQVFGALLRWTVITRDQLMELLYGCRTNPPCQDSIRFLIMRLRRKLKPHGIVIHTVWGRGYTIDEWSRKRLSLKSNNKNSENIAGAAPQRVNVTTDSPTVISSRSMQGGKAERGCK